MNALIDAAIARSRTVLSALFLLLVAGALTYISIPKESSPDINIPIIYVSMHHDGISPEDAEKLLVQPMETELRGIEGIKEMTSAGYQDGAFVMLEFDAGFDADTALDDVRQKVDRAQPELPADTDEPTVSEVNFSLFPVLVVTLSGDVTERSLLRIADKLQDRIEGIDTVLEANIVGKRDEVVEIEIDPVAIQSYGLDGGTVIAFFQRSNQLVAAGNLDRGQGRFAIKVPGLFENVRDIMEMPVLTQGDSVVRIMDIATIKRTFKDPESFARVNGERAVAIEVVKRSGENIIDTIAAVRAVVEDERQHMPPAVSVGYSQDQSDNIRTMLSDLQNNVIAAIILVMIVCVAALGVRSAGFVGVAIPGSFLTGMLVIGMMGLTVNIVVLFSLILAVGMLVDGAIVVTEFADRRMAEGADKAEAYADAAKRMAWPIIASTATTLAAFMPLLFWPGIMGEFMKYMPITLLATLTASLAMALIFVPTLGSIFGKPGALSPASKSRLTAIEKGDLNTVGGGTGVYLKVLGVALSHPGAVILTAIAMLIGVQWYYANHGNGVEFFPEIEPEIAIVQVHARGNLSIYERDNLMREVEHEVLQVEGIDIAYSRTGQGEGGGFGNDQAPDVIGSITLELDDWDERQTADQIMTEIRERTAYLAGITVETRKFEEGPPTGKPIAAQISSRFPELLEPAALRLRQGLEELGGFKDIEDSRPLPGIQWALRVDRAQASKFGLDISNIGQSIQLITNGVKVGDYRPADATDEVDILIRYPADYRSLEQLAENRIESPQVGSVPISNFVRREAEPLVGQVDRIDGQRIITVKADVAEGLLANDKLVELQQWVASSGNLDPRVSITWKGENEEQKESEEFLTRAFGAALFIMAIILVTQFNSFYSALLILSAVVMSTIGVMMGLLLTGKPFGVVMSGIGVIALAGIVVNNNIVLIDTFDHLKDRTASVREAIMRTGAQRLRPVLLTTTTTMLGLLPMMMQVNIDFVSRSVQQGAPSSQWWDQLAAAIVFGLGFATVLTLIVTPSALMLYHNISSRIGKLKAKVDAAKPTRDETPEGTPAQTDAPSSDTGDSSDAAGTAEAEDADQTDTGDADDPDPDKSPIPAPG
ncbi:MAG: multidrug efflux RND transporter permease subunit VmeK [Alphaproteobacteria bacterium]